MANSTATTIKPVLFVKNISREGPGIFEKVCIGKNQPYEIIDLTLLTSIPRINNYGAVVMLGGPASANDNSHVIRLAFQIVDEAIGLNLPFLGVCLGLQILVKATGGEVVKSVKMEIGFSDGDSGYYEVELTEEGKSDRLCDSVSEKFRVFHLHGETVILSPGTTLLGVGKECKNQFVRVGSYQYGIQGHIEITGEMLESWIVEDTMLRTANRPELLAGFEMIKDQMRLTGQQIFENFLHLAQQRVRDSNPR